MSKKISAIIILSLAIIFYFIGYFTHSIKAKQSVPINSTNINFDIPANEIPTLDYPSIHLHYDDIIGKIDYPLIDVYFDNDNDWIILKSDGLVSDNPEFTMIRDVHSVEHIKDKISILTFPVGHGTTANGTICIFKNEILIKSVPYIESYISDENLSALFETVAEEEVASLLAH